MPTAVDVRDSVRKFRRTRGREESGSGRRRYVCVLSLSIRVGTYLCIFHSAVEVGAFSASLPAHTDTVQCLQ